MVTSSPKEVTGSTIFFTQILSLNSANVLNSLFVSFAKRLPSGKSWIRHCRRLLIGVTFCETLISECPISENKHNQDLNTFIPLSHVFASNEFVL